MKNKMSTENYVMNRILELQIILKEDCERDMSLEDILLFLEDAMNYGAFQIELLDYKLGGISLSYFETIRLFLSENDNEDILWLYRNAQNFNDVNIESIEERLYGDNNVPVNGKQKSMKILTKAMLR